MLAGFGEGSCRPTCIPRRVRGSDEIGLVKGGMGGDDPGKEDGGGVGSG